MANTFKFGNGQWAVGKETALAYNDENSNFKPLPFTFDRGSTATVVNKNGLIETVGVDEPRIDFLNNTNGHLLLEPSRQNKLLQSNQFDTTWVSLNTTETGGQVGVGGSNNAWLITKSAPSARIYQTISVSGVQTYSVYAKAGTLNWVAVSNNLAYTFFNLSNGTIGTNVGTTNANIDDVGNGWYRCSITYSGTATDARIYPSQGDNNSNGTSGNIYIQYAQLEVGSYATSYIPTSGSAVTRSADYTKIVNSPILQATNQFTLFFDAKDFVNYGATFANIMITLGAAESPYDVGTGIHIYNKIWYYFNGSSAVTLGNCYNAITDSKFAISYDGTKFTRYSNGVKLGTNTTSASMSNWDTITNGSLSYSGVDRVFDIADLKLYDTALSDSELQALTQV